MHAKTICTWASVAIEALAAVLWLVSTIAKKSYADVEREYQKTHGPGSGPGGIVGEDGTDFCGTAQLQGKWNRWAALATALGVALQALGTALPDH